MHRNGGRLCPQYLLALLCCLFLVRDAASQIQGVGPPVLRGVRPNLPVLDLDLIISYVTVTAPKGITPPRFSARDFHLFEDNVEQKIDYFAVQDQPATVGIVWGAGTGFEDPAPDWDARECPREFMKAMPVGSEYFVLSGDTVSTSFTTDLRRLPVNFALSGASTDTVYIGLDVLKEAANPRKILLVLRKTELSADGQLDRLYLERVAIRQGFQVHVASFLPIDLRDANVSALDFFAEIADLTGGTYYTGPPSKDYCRNLGRELRLQYVLGHHPTNEAKDGKWRKLSVSIDSSDDGPKFKARIRRGYYAGKE